MPSNLTELDVVEVSLVDKAANKRKFLIMKNDGNIGESDMPKEKEDNGVVLNVESEATAEVLKSIAEMDDDRIAAIKSLSELDQETLTTLLKYEESDKDLAEAITKAGISDKAQKAVKVALQALSSVKNELGDDIMKKLAAAGGFPAPKDDEKKKPEGDKEMTEKSKDKGSDPMALVKKNDDGTADFTDVPENVRPLVEQLWKQNEETAQRAAENERILKEERDTRVLKEYVHKAEGFKHLGVDPEKFGGILKSASEKLSTEEFAELNRVLKAADEKMAPLFKELGTGGDGEEDTSAYAQLEKKAEEIQKSSDGSLTKQQAFTKALDLYPDLAKKEMEERSTQH